MTVNNDVIEKIPPLYNQGETKTNTFKVNIFGNMNSLNAINSFMWIVPKDMPIENQQVQNESLPDFSDL